MAGKVVVHRRAVSLDGGRWTVLSLRPAQPERFATNRYHDTWHVLSDVAGASLLGRICWALSYQRVERTIFVIERSHLVPNPFDADPSAPIVIVNADLGTPGHDARVALKRHLPLRGVSEGRVTLAVGGLDRLDSYDELYEEQRRTGEAYVPERTRRWVDRVDGLLILSAPSPVLRSWGALLVRLGDRLYKGMNYTELDWPNTNGEAQIFRDFGARVTRATIARERLFPGRSYAELTDDERRQIYDLTSRASPPAG